MTPTDFNGVLREDAVDISVQAGDIVPPSSGRTDYIFGFEKEDIEFFQRQGDDLVIILNDGQVVTLQNYYVDAFENALIFPAEGGAMVIAPSPLLLAGAGLLAAAALLGGGSSSSAGDDTTGGGNDTTGGGNDTTGGGNDTTGGGNDTTGGGNDTTGGGNDTSGGSLIDLAVTDGFESTGDLFNQDNHADGVELAGTTDPGASVSVSVGDTTHTAVADADGNWAVTFSNTEIPGGETTVEATLVSTDPEGNTTTLTEAVVLDTLVAVAIDTPVSGDNVLASADTAGDFVVTGTADPGSTVSVQINGVDHAATVAADGSWSATIPSATWPTVNGDVAVNATAIDPAGNTATTTATLTLDLTADISIGNSGEISDGVINNDDLADGEVSIGGTADPGSTVVVTVGDTTQTTTADGDGNWTVTVPGDAVGDQDGNLTVTAEATDPNGNTANTTTTVNVDRVVEPLTINPVTGDDLVNGADRDGSVTITGTVEPGATANVTFVGITRPATVNSDGTWEVTFTTDEIPLGETNSTASVTATDAAGNTLTASRPVEIDTVVTPLTVSPVAGDNVINASEAENGVALSGTVEPNSVVNVTFGTVSKQVTAGADGNWSVTYAQSELPADSAGITATVIATDPVGNSREIDSQAIVIDTSLPANAITTEVDFATIDSGAQRVAQSISVFQPDSADLQVYQLDGAGAAQVVNTDPPVTSGNNVQLDFTTPVPDGSRLVITSSDTAGNSSGTLLVIEDATTPNLELNQFISAGLDVTSIDLWGAEATTLTISEGQLNALAAGTDDLYVRGGNEDQVNASGATDTGTQVTVDGVSYNAYTFSADGGILYIEDGVSVTI